MLRKDLFLVFGTKLAHGAVMQSLLTAVVPNYFPLFTVHCIVVFNTLSSFCLKYMLIFYFVFHDKFILLIITAAV